MVHSTAPLSDDLRERVIEKYKQRIKGNIIANELCISESSVSRIISNYNKGIKSHIKPDRALWKNPNAKITENYVNELESLIEDENDLFDDELADRLRLKTGITLKVPSVCALRKKLGITVKLKSWYYHNRFDDKNVKQEKEFKELHHYKTGTRKLNECMSTDEGGFKSTIQRVRAKSKIRRVPRGGQNKSIRRKLGGGSYKDNDSKARGKIQKHATFKINLILSISLHKDYPVVHYEFSDTNFNSVKFSDFVLNRGNLPNLKFDLIDRASFHTSDAVAEEQYVSTREAYNRHDLVRDLVPTGYPELNPVEQAIGWIKQFVKREARKYHDGSGWSRNRLRSTIIEAINNITHNLVKSWFRSTYTCMYPNHQVPSYLR